MAEKRKLQAEIDKTLKRVEEGIADFDVLVEKAQEAATSSQKEKLETELKREIKKLQRLRDQIKSWLASSEVKDKASLEDCRKAIEKEMEKFKVYEKLFKIKAFSKEGLAQQVKVDPLEAEKDKHRKWLRDTVEKMSTRIDFQEVALESARSNKRGKGKGVMDTEKVVEAEAIVVRLKCHVTKLELILRLLENDTIDMSLLPKLEASLNDFLEDPDEVFLDDQIYDDLGLELPDVTISREMPYLSEDAPSTHNVTTQPVVPVESHHESLDAVTDYADQTPPVTSHKMVDSTVVTDIPSKADITSGAVVSSAVRRDAGLPHAMRQKLLRVILTEQDFTSHQIGTQTKDSLRKTFTAGCPVPIPTAPSLRPPSSPPPTLRTAPDTRRSPVMVPRIQPPMKTVSGRADDVVTKLPTVSQRRHFRYYQPKTLWTNPPSSFPTRPLKNFATAEFFAKLDLDTLFFTFYHQQGTYQQYLAAKELKRKSWCYHKKYLTWFHAQPGPQTVTDRGRRGTYVYFDSETGWCSRVKNDFTFEFTYLENEMAAPTTAVLPTPSQPNSVALEPTADDSTQFP